MQEFKKEAKSFQDQIDLLKARGLIIEGEFEAKETLKNISYYRLSGYFYPFLKDKENHIFYEGTRFNDVIDLYNFDRELRLIIFDAIEKIEIAFRSQLIYNLSMSEGPWWFENINLFDNPKLFADQLAKLEQNLEQSDERFIEHYKSKYNPKNPPAWMTLDIVSFNQISQWYKNLKVKEIRKKISLHFESNYIELESWIHTVVYLRNLCAHHCRVWNRRFGVSPKFPLKPLPKPFINDAGVTNGRLYYNLAVLQYFLNAIYPECSFKPNILNLLERYPKVDKPAMGFPATWHNDPFWQINI
jgi:abortive infection bacteriophage resistance protein